MQSVNQYKKQSKTKEVSIVTLSDSDDDDEPKPFFFDTRPSSSIDQERGDRSQQMEVWQKSYAQESLKCTQTALNERKNIHSSWQVCPGPSTCSAAVDDSIMIIEETVQKPKSPFVISCLDDSVVVLGSPSYAENLSKARKRKTQTEPKSNKMVTVSQNQSMKTENPDVIPISLDDSVLILGSPSHKENVPKAQKVKQWFCQDVTARPRQKTQFAQKIDKRITASQIQAANSKTVVRQRQITESETPTHIPVPSFDCDEIVICEVTSTTKENTSSTSQRMALSQNQKEVCDLSRKRSPAPDIIPLTPKRKFECKKNCASKKRKLNTPTTLSKRQRHPVHRLLRVAPVPRRLEPSVPIPLRPDVSRRLRPVVIDGSNIACSHGRVSQTYSCRGIQICVDHFLKMGHEVTCFVPQYRKFAINRRNCPTTDPGILDDLAQRQLLVFTPSRVLNGQRINSYDDRFMIQLASVNGGVVVSNDHYNDLINENVYFRKVIEERLIPYCFIRDIFMPAVDPLGRDGPRLNEVLRFGQNEQPPSET